MANKNLFTKFASLAMAGALAFSAVPVGGLTGVFADEVTPGDTYTELFDNYKIKAVTKSGANDYQNQSVYWTGQPVTFSDYISVTGDDHTVDEFGDDKELDMKNNTGSNVGTYKMNISTKDNLTLTSADISFKIKELNIANEDIRNNLDLQAREKLQNFTYRDSTDDLKVNNVKALLGTLKFTGVNSQDDEITVSSGTNAWNVELDSDKEAGEKTGTLVGDDNRMTGSKNFTYKINEKSIEDPVILNDVGDKPAVNRIGVYVENAAYANGNVPSPNVVVKHTYKVNGEDVTTTLTKDTDYTVSYSGTEVGKGTAIITGVGNYTGTISPQFDIVDADKNITGGTVKLYEDAAKTKTFTGGTFKNDEIKPAAVEVIFKDEDGERVVVDNNDLDISYTNDDDDEVNHPKSAGTVNMTITAKGDYAGSVTASYVIDPLELKSSMFGSIDSATYDGEEVTPAVKVRPLANDITLKVDDDDITVEGNNTEGSKDFILNYQNNVNAGKATAIIEGTRNYTGTISKEFTIKALNFSTNNSSVESIANQVVTGAAIEPAPVVTYYGPDGTKETSDDVVLGLDADYTLTYKSNVNKGNASITINGTGNFAGTKTASFKIVDPALSIANAEVELVADSALYDGTNKVASVKSVKIPDASQTSGYKTLTLDKEYEVKTTVGKEVGTYPVVINGIGNYGGTKSVDFTITGYDVNDAGFSLKKTSVKYNGKNQKPELVVAEGTRFDGTNMTEGVDYEVSGIKNIKNVGKLTVKVTGIGAYAGTEKSLTFKVTKADQPMKVSTKTASVKASKVAKKNQTIKASKVFSVSKNQGSVSYKKTSGNSKIKVASNGKITVKKGLKKGTYKIKVKVTAKGNSNYNSGNKTVKATIKVK